MCLPGASISGANACPEGTCVLPTWIEILSTDKSRLAVAAERYRVHPLALEDCEHRDQRPNLDDYETHQLLVWFMFASEHIYEIQILIFSDLLIVVPHESPPQSANWHDYLRISDQHRDVWHMLYQALDRATDMTWVEIKKLMNQVDEFEQDLFKGEMNPQVILLVKKKLNEIDASIGHLASVTKQVVNLSKPTGDLIWKFRDLHDHCERLSRSIELYRAQIVTAIELCWGMQANRTNRQIKRLTLLASISVPLTFWASFWGMNFEFIPFSKPELFTFAMVMMGISVAITFWLLVRKGYWAD